tara:strand:- start:824 stop:1015 length:192 start_codon:yes stop_codon:yes gene_type:complete
MVLSKKEEKSIKKRIDKLDEGLAFAVYAKVDDMHEVDMSKSEITKLLTRNLKFYINESFESYD